ncbi:hypothetical protein FRIG_13690, partial [Frigoribacterium faeni]|uniref:hypothetical protein n=1 Tax=Frigoribacterium faeni TaxID=145483 RepID=UPI001FAC3BBD
MRPARRPSPHDATGVRDATRASSTPRARRTALAGACLLYTSDAADDGCLVELSGVADSVRKNKTRGVR